MKRLIFAGLTFTLTACGLSVDHKDEKKDENYSYEFEENGCKTGKQEFSSKADYCSGLKNDGLNNGCAASLRQKAYETDCQ